MKQWLAAAKKTKLEPLGIFKREQLQWLPESGNKSTEASVDRLGQVRGAKSGVYLFPENVL